MVKDLKVFNREISEKYSLVEVVKCEINTENGPRNLVLWGRELDKNFILSSGILRKVQKYYKSYNSEVTINFERVICKRFEREVFKRNKGNLVLVLGSIKDLFYLENNSLKSIEDIIDSLIKKIEISHKNKARIVFTTIPNLNKEEKLYNLVREVNSWIRNSKFLDGYIDIDKFIKENKDLVIEDKEELENYILDNIEISYLVNMLKPFELDYKSQEELIKSMNENSKIINEKGNEILIKGIPDPVEGTRIDRRIKYFHEHKRPEKKNNPYVFNGEAVGNMRENMGLLNVNLCRSKILSKEEVIDGVNCRVYKKDLLKGKLNPCIVYMHGGAFIGGSLEVSENPCKLLAEKTNSIVISVDYALAPEKPYPKGLNDCRKVINYIEENFLRYNIDKDKIGVLGESAGANFAAILANENDNLKFQGLIYPLVSFVYENPFFTWSKGYYNNEYDEKLVDEFILSLKNCEGLIDKLYIQKDIDLKREDISPIFNRDLSKSKRALITVSEYDYLRIQGEIYGKLLKEAKVKTKIIRYEGVNHAFLDNLGIYPQAEDVINEMSKEFLDAINNI